MRDFENLKDKFIDCEGYKLDCFGDFDFEDVICMRKCLQIILPVKLKRNFIEE